MALPPVGGGGELSPSEPKEGEAMKATSKKTARFSQEAISSQGEGPGKVSIEGHRVSKKPAEGSKGADQKIYDLEPKKGLSSS